MEPKQLSTLPDEVIYTILLILPVKALARFKCVSKQWRYLISHDPHFIKTHAYINRSRQNLLLFWSIRYDGWVKGKLSVHSVDPIAPPDGCPDANHHPVSKFQNSNILGSVNGVVFLTDGWQCCFLWNPSMKVCEELDPSVRECMILDTDDVKRKGPSLFGFFYEWSTDDYKFVVVNDQPSGAEVCVKIYSSKTNTFKEGSFPFRILDATAVPQTATLVNESPHWMVMCGIKKEDSSEIQSCGHKIIWFDVREEVFNELPQPNYGGQDGEMKNYSLGELDSCFCVAVHEQNNAAVWIMKEYAWTKLFHVTQLPGIESYKKIRPLCLTQDHEEVVMVVDSKKLVAYNPREKSGRAFPVPDAVCRIEVDVFTESLFVPNVMRVKVGSKIRVTVV